jgi:hypothetical protein
MAQAGPDLGKSRRRSGGGRSPGAAVSNKTKEASMVKRLLLVMAFVFAVFTGYALGQKAVKPLPGGHVFSGGDLGFHADEPLADVMTPGRRSVTGKFVVNVNGQWLEARPGMGVVPVR